MGFVLIDFIFQFIVWGEVKVIVRSSSVYKRTQIVPEPLNCSVNGLLWRVPVGSVCINLDFYNLKSTATNSDCQIDLSQLWFLSIRPTKDVLNLCRSLFNIRIHQS